MSDEYTDKQFQKVEIEEAISAIADGGADQVGQLNLEISEIDIQITELQKVLARNDQVKALDATIQLLKAEEKKLGGEIEAIDEEIKRTEHFTRVKVSMLDSKIVAKFPDVRFRMFEEQVNGGLRDCCDVCDLRGVIWNDLSDSEQYHAGMSIVEPLTEEYGLIIPIVIDHAESISNIGSTQGQQIKLYVDETLPELVITKVAKGDS